MSEKNCKHGAYRLAKGELVCSVCGEPSKSAKWRGNIFGVNSKKSKPKE